MLHCFIKFFLASAIFTFNCSVEYISLKALCYHQDKNVSEAIQKKIYGILAPLFSQKPSYGESKEQEITYTDYLKIQAGMFFLMLKGWPKDVLSIVFDQSLMFVRQYQYFHDYTFCYSIPVLYKNKNWWLQNRNALLVRYKGQRGWLDYFKSLVGWEVIVSVDFLKLSVLLGDDVFIDDVLIDDGLDYDGHDCQKISMPMAVLKSQNKLGNDVFICLFESGCISIVDPNSLKEIWHRTFYEATQNDCNSILPYGQKSYIKFLSYGHLIGGYRNILCFRPFEQKNVLKFYTIDQVMNDKSCEYQITDVYDETIFNYNQSEHKLVSTLNSNYFFYTFYKRQRNGFEGRFMNYVVSKEDDLYKKFKMNDLVYYCNYAHEKQTKKQIAIKLKDDLFFVCFSCNDTTLIAQDNQKNIYVFNISTEPFKYTFFIPYDNKSCLNSHFWLDSDSDKILTRKGVFKIQDVFAGLPINKLENCKVENGFFKGVFLRIYWFIRSWYWAIKKRACAIAYALLRINV